jgi:hypothetical protein
LTAVLDSRAAHNAHPFDGQGASLYVTAGDTVKYRAIRVQNRRRGAGVCRQGWTGRNPKTLRVASDTGVSGDQIDFAHDISALPAGEYAVDVRHFKGDVENLTDNNGIVRIEIDGSADPVLSVLGTATWLEPEILAGGIVRLRWTWHPSLDGVQPDTFRIDFTAGPTSPSDLTLDVSEGLFEYELLTGALDDASAYTVSLKAELGAVSTTLLSGKTFQADATAPATPTLVSIIAR